MLGTLVHATIPVQQNSLTAPEGISPKTNYQNGMLGSVQQ